MGLSSVISEAVEAINSGESRKKVLAQKLLPLKKKELGFECSALPEQKLVFPVEKAVLNCSVAGVDSGFVAKKLSSVDLVLIRAVGVLFSYKNSVVSKADYFPNFFSFPEPHLAGSALEDDEAEQSKSLMRLKEEVRVSKEIIEKHSPKYLFIDGSIIPQYQDKPRNDSKLAKNYIDIIKEFESLYALAEKNGTTLIATVEDSRGSRFLGILQDDVLKNGNSHLASSDSLGGLFDSGFLDYFLNLNERTCAFTYTKNIKQHPVLHDFKAEWSNSLYAFYLKPAQFDRPLRVEFICRNNLSEKVSEIASVVLALSSMHREYAYPSVLIEADLRAKLRPDEIEIVYNKIMDKLGNSTKLRMRRDNRPF